LRAAIRAALICAAPVSGRPQRPRPGGVGAPRRSLHYVRARAALELPAEAEGVGFGREATERAAASRLSNRDGRLFERLTGRSAVT